MNIWVYYKGFFEICFVFILSLFFIVDAKEFGCHSWREAHVVANNRRMLHGPMRPLGYGEEK